MAFQRASVAHSAVSRMDRPCERSEILLPPPASESCWMHAAPFRSLLLTPPAEVTPVERFRNNVHVVKSCEVTSRPVYLCSERVHRRGVVLFHALMSHCVHPHPEGTDVLRGTSSDAEHARVEPRSPRSQMTFLQGSNSRSATAGWRALTL